MFDKEKIESIKTKKEEWDCGPVEKVCAKFPERRPTFTTISGEEVERLYTPTDIADFDYDLKLGFPGEYPFTRGVQPTMYRGRLWTMRQYAGFGTARETNERYRYLLQQGQTGLSVAFDLPTQSGYDSDHQLSMGEVGKVGVAIDSIDDMRVLFDQIPLDKVTTSMTINAPATGTLSITGDWTRNAGTFNNNSSNVVFSGNGAQILGGSLSTAFNNITVNSSSIISITTDPTAVGTVINNGAMQQRKAVSGSNTIPFLRISTAYYGVDINPSNNDMGMTEVTVYGNQVCTYGDTSTQVRRCFSIKPQTATAGAYLTFYYTNAEINDLNPSSMNIYHWGGSQWQPVTLAGRGITSPYYVIGTGITSYSQFVLGTATPTAVKLSAFAATGSKWVYSLLISLGLALVLARRRR